VIFWLDFLLFFRGRFPQKPFLSEQSFFRNFFGVIVSEPSPPFENWDAFSKHIRLRRKSKGGYGFGRHLIPPPTALYDLTF